MLQSQANLAEHSVNFILSEIFMTILNPLFYPLIQVTSLSIFHYDIKWPFVVRRLFISLVNFIKSRYIRMLAHFKYLCLLKSIFPLLSVKLWNIDALDNSVLLVLSLHKDSFTERALSDSPYFLVSHLLCRVCFLRRWNWRLIIYARLEFTITNGWLHSLILFSFYL